VKKRIVIVDDHPIVRQGFVQLINQQPDLTVIGEAEDAPEALGLILETTPDISLVDLSLKNSSGLELIKDLCRRIPDMPILVVSLHDEDVYAERVLRAGAKGFIMKAEATENVMTAIRQVLGGGIYLSQRMRTKLLEKLTTGVSYQDSGTPVEQLSDREFEVFQLIGKGMKTSAIADTLNLSIKTIETYRSHLKIKLNLKDSTALMQTAVEWTLKNKC
jgi:DNA-binding NarL/FixJ family response regulator